MLRIKSNIPVETFKKYGFKKCGEYYYYSNDESEIFIWRSETDSDYKKRGIYIDVRDYTMVLTDLDILYDLINDGIVEKI